MADTPTQVFTMRVPADVAAQIRRLAVTEDRSASSVIRLAVREYLDHHAPSE